MRSVPQDRPHHCPCAGRTRRAARCKGRSCLGIPRSRSGRMVATTDRLATAATPSRSESLCSRRPNFIQRAGPHRPPDEAAGEFFLIFRTFPLRITTCNLQRTGEQVLRPAPGWSRSNAPTDRRDERALRHAAVGPIRIRYRSRSARLLAQVRVVVGYRQDLVSGDQRDLQIGPGGTPKDPRIHW